MSAAFDKAVAFVIPHETEYVRGHWGDDAYAVTENVPGDGGGLTKYGIDQRSHPRTDIRNLTRAGAIEIYRDEWNAHQLDDLPDKLAIAMFDVWVNGGYATKWLQQALNQADTTGAAPLQVDGFLGPKSLAAARACDQAAVANIFLQERDARFRALAQKPNQAQFLAGWLQRDRDLAAYLAA